jgi:signal transduction histidine kinase
LWTLVGLAFASQLYLSSNLLGRSVTWGEAIGASLGDWYVWAVLSLPILWLARRFPPEREPRWAAAAIHLAAALGCSLLYVVLRSLVGEADGWLHGETSTFADIFQPLLVRTFPFNLLIYGVIVALSHALDYYRKYHERTVQALELEKHLAQARLQALLHQLEPHFLFNTLNGIASLMHSDVEAADAMLVRLGGLLRTTMAQNGAPRVPLREEIAFIRRYLEIEEIRFRGRLAVEIAIAPEALDALVPTLVLQPLVENAIRHGVEPHPRPGRVEITGQRAGGRLLLAVADNGEGLKPGAGGRTGIGLPNTRARLAELYGPDHDFALGDRPGGGLLVRLALPFEAAAVSG